MDSNLYASSRTSIALLVVLGLIVLKTFLILRRAYLSPLRKVPGPKYAAFTNLALKVAVIRGQRSQYIHRLHSIYGPIIRISPTEVAIADLEAFRTIHKIGSPFTKSPWYAKFSNTNSPGIFAMTDTKRHAARRRLFAQPFSNTSILRYEQIVKTKIDMAVSKIERDARAAMADIFKWWTYMATDVSAQLSFGKSFDMLEQEQKTQYIRDLETTMIISGMRVELPWLFSIARLLPIKSVQHVLGLNKRLDSYGEHAIQNHKEYLTTKSSSDQTTSLFAKFLDPSKQQEELSDYEISQEAGNLIVAGSDTTAVTLTYLIWAVLRPVNSHVRAKLSQEIADMPIDSSAKDVSNLQYLKNVINETLRLYGAAPGSLPRITPPGGAVLGGYEIPEGTTVSTQAYTLHRNSAIFIDPDSFLPERWENPSQDMLDAFSPFGAGSRACIGLHLALLELQLSAFAFFKRCPTARLAPTTTDESMEFENYFLIAPKSHKCEVVIPS